MPLHKELGNAIWFLLHVLAIRVGENPSSDLLTSYWRFFNQLTTLMPCSKCRQHTQSFIKSKVYKQIPPNQLSEKINHLHNLVNRHLEKPKTDFTLEESVNRYLPFVSDQRLILSIVFKVVLTYSHHWKNHWRLGVQPEQRAFLYQLIVDACQILGLEPKHHNLPPLNPSYTYGEIYFLSTEEPFKLTPKEVPPNFVYNTRGCNNCVNK